MLYRGNTATITSQTTAGIFIRFNSDGSKLFVFSDDVQAAVREYSLSTPYDLSTLSYTQKLDVYLEVAETVTGFAMSLDGAKLYVLERGDSAEIHEWTLSTGFDLSTATYTRGHRVSEYDNDSIYGCRISGDGTKFYIWWLSNNGDVYQHSLSTPYNVSTESFDAFYDINDSFDHVRDITFTDSGSKVWVLNNTGEILQRNLATPYDLSTASAVQATGTRPEGTSALAFEFTADGERLFTVSGDDLYEVLCTQLSTLVFPPSVEIPTSGVPIVYEEKTALSIVTSDGGTSYQVTNVQGAIK